jgi:methionine synthase I (cobalamin-dependent)
LVEVLLKACADPNIRSKLGSTALGQAEQAQREQVVGMLTEAGAVRAVGIDLAALMETFLGRQYKRLTERLPDVKILGGCCGTDHRHIEESCMACVSE